INSILSIPIPQTKHQLQQLLGASNFVRPFIPSYAQMVQPLTDSLKSGIWRWWPEIGTALEQLKSAVLSLKVLVSTEKGDRLIIFADASEGAVAGVVVSRRGLHGCFSR
ncbi:MAG: hypothetical protein ACRCSI_01670, partial [Eubacterium aggregans]